MLETRANKNIRKNDTVIVLSGRSRGKSGRVLKVVPERHTLIVEKVNFIKKHQRPTSKMKQGGVVEREGELRLDNVMLMCPKCLKPTRIRIEMLKEGHKRRVCKKCKEVIETKK